MSSASASEAARRRAKATNRGRWRVSRASRSADRPALADDGAGASRPIVGAAGLVWGSAIDIAVMLAAPAATGRTPLPDPSAALDGAASATQSGPLAPQ